MKTPKELKTITNRALKNLGYLDDLYSLFVKRTPTMGYAIKTVIYSRRGKSHTEDPAHQQRLRKELESLGLEITAVRQSCFCYGRGGAGDEAGVTFYCKN